MLKTLGHGLSPMASRPLSPFKKLHLTSTLPSEITFTRNSAATHRDAQGKLVSVLANEPRFDHTANGTPLGLFIEPSSTNRCENNNINPTDTTGFTTNNKGTISVVDDSAELSAAGLDAICTSGKVFKAEANSSSTFIVYIPGTAGTINPCSYSFHARGEGSGSRTARLSLGGTLHPIAPAGDGYTQYKFENETPDGTGRKITISVDGNETLYFILYQLEESSYCTSLIPVNGTAVTRPADRPYIDNIGQYDWFNNNQGYMACRYSQERLLNSDAYAAVLNDGSSSNTLGLRLDSTNHNLRAFVRSSGSSQFISANNDYQIVKTLNSAGIRWNTNESEIISGGQTAQDTITNLPNGINRLDIGSRNGGSSPMHGHIEYLEIGVRDLNTKQLGNRIQTTQDLAIIGAGQSLMRGHFNSQESNSEAGKQKHRELIGQVKRDKCVILLDGSTGSSAACKTSNNTNYWWDNDNNVAGPALNNFHNEVSNAGITPTTVLWAQGEEDSHDIGNNTSESDYKSALEAVFNNIRATYGNVNFYIQHIGRRTSFSNIGGVQVIRNIQKELITENSWCYSAAEIYDLDLHDQVHLTDNAYVTAAQRNAASLLNQTGAMGLEIISASRSGSTISVNLLHDGGNDFTPTNNIDGFKFFDNGSEISISSAIKANSTTIAITLANIPSSGIETLYYGYDSLSSINIANIVTDNAALPKPLRTAKVEL